jgi:ATP-dependent DNA helicase DinG
MSSAIDQLGRVTQLLPGGGESRPGQEQMAAAVAETVDKSACLLVEAGTGTGKSLAYLAPIVAAGQRAVIATATIALQGQLVDNDVPLVASGLGQTVTAAVLKGRNNYLCRQRLAEFDRSSRTEQLDLLRGARRDDEIGELRAWAETTVTGDREELDPAPPSEVWQALSVGGDECPGAARCPSGDSCFSEQARAVAREADVIVTNHHYYGLHIASDGALLPDHDIVVFDEAHHLPEVLSATCGSELSGNRFRALSRRVRGVLTGDKLALGLDQVAMDLDNLLRDEVGERITIDADLIDSLVTGRDRADQVIAGLRKASPPEGSDTEAKVERAMLAATSLVADVDAVIESDEGDVLWVDGNDNNPILKRTPLDVGQLLIDRLWGEVTAVLTSATLPEGLASQLGIKTGTKVLRVGSPFDYERLGLLYCAAHLPDPRQSGSRQQVHDEMFELIEAAGGRTLGLFTSNRAMREAADALTDRLDVPVIVQGDSSRSALITRFLADPETVLLATLSFWQGVDLPGDTLTLVTIDRLPFPRPDEPVLQARRRRAGASAFRTIDLPRAQILLAQGAGRLIRRADDKGVVAVLDARLATNRNYRWDLISALPPFKRTKDKAEVLEFLRSLDQSSTDPGIS